MANDSGNEWQLNKNGKLKMGVLVRFPGDSDPFGKVVHVTESEALVKRFDTGKREPMSLKSEVEWQMPGEDSGEGQEPAKKAKKDKGSPEPSKSTKPKKEKDSADSKPVKPKREKPSRPEDDEEETDTDDNNETNNEDEQEPEVKAKEKKPSKSKKSAPATASDKCYTAEEMSALTGHNAQWIGRNRAEIFEASMWRVNTEAGGRGRKPVVYSSEALEVLRNTPIPTRGGGRRKSADADEKPVKPKARKIEQRDLFTKGEVNVKISSTESPATGRGRKKAAAVADPASDALDAIEAAITAAEAQRDAHAQRYETLIAGLRKHKADLEFLAAGIAG